jgi:hypothetical protein
MTRGPRRLWAVLAAAALLVAVVVVGISVLGADESEDQPALERRVLLGFNDIAFGRGRATPAQVAELAKGAGAGIYRVAFDWRAVEPQPGLYDIRRYDALYAELLRRGIRPLFILMSAPLWAAEAVGCPADCHTPPAPRADAAWREVAALLARRYPRAAGIEIWNEPNDRGFWWPGPDPRRYAALLGQAYRAIKAVNPRMRVIAGALTGRAATTTDGISTAGFLRALYRNGAGEDMDAISIHPYTAGDDFGGLERLLRATRSVRDRAGGGSTPLWVTEYGFSTTGPPGSKQRVTEPQQAALLVRAYRRLRASDDVGAIVFHTLLDPPAPAPGRVEDGFGVVRGDFSRKPAYCALARAVPSRVPCR